MTTILPVSAASLEAKIRNDLQANYVEIDDMSGGCGQAFSCIIVSPLFEKKTTLARHRLVNTSLKAEIATIHAWTSRCYTPTQWQEIKDATANIGDSQQ